MSPARGVNPPSRPTAGAGPRSRAGLLVAVVSCVVLSCGGANGGEDRGAKRSPVASPEISRDAADAEAYLKVGVTDSEVAAIREVLLSSNVVHRIAYVDRDAAWEEFMRLTVDDPDLRERVTREDLPTSFRIQLAGPAAGPELVATLEARAEVEDVVLPAERSDPSEPRPAL